MKLLIVDDSPMIRSAIKVFLESDQIQVVGQAEDGKQALTLFDEHKPDIVTMDITMPEMDGLTCLQKMLETGVETKVIVVTALADKATGLKAIELGADAFVLKPFTKEELLSAVERVMGS